MDNRSDVVRLEDGQLVNWYDHLVELDAINKAVAQLVVGFLESEPIDLNPRLALGVGIIQSEAEKRLEQLMAEIACVGKLGLG